jgi:hypothetical protein
MSIETMLSNVSYYGSFAWMYGIKSDLWNAAVQSYRKNVGQLKKPHLITLIDYRILGNEPRLWTLALIPPVPIRLCHTLVAHGSGSGKGKKVMWVSRERGSNKSCVGGFVTKHIYESRLGQKDKSKTRPALVLEGLDPTNDNARSRGIRMHGAWYVKDNSAGNSHGCICCKQDIHEALIKIVHGGSFMFSYFGDDYFQV